MVDLRARLHKEKDIKKTQTKYYNLYTQNQKNRPRGGRLYQYVCLQQRRRSQEVPRRQVAFYLEIRYQLLHHGYPVLQRQNTHQRQKHYLFRFPERAGAFQQLCLARGIYPCPANRVLQL